MGGLSLTGIGVQALQGGGVHRTLGQRVVARGLQLGGGAGDAADALHEGVVQLHRPGLQGELPPGSAGPPLAAAHPAISFQWVSMFLGRSIFVCTYVYAYICAHGKC